MGVLLSIDYCLHLMNVNVNHIFSLIAYLLWLFALVGCICTFYQVCFDWKDVDAVLEGLKQQVRCFSGEISDLLMHAAVLMLYVNLSQP